MLKKDFRPLPSNLPEDSLIQPEGVDLQWVYFFMSDREVAILERMAENLERNDIINKRLTHAIIIMAISFSVTLISISYFYFCNENSVPTINQTTSNNSTINAGRGK